MARIRVRQDGGLNADTADTSRTDGVTLHLRKRTIPALLIEPVNEGHRMTPRTTFSSAASWTHKLDSDKQQEHDFCNLLQELGYAVRREDGKMMEYCECELRRMYRDRRPQKGRR